jgi:hypothetical protein
MVIPRNSGSAAEPPRLAGRFVASQALLWMLAAPVLGAAVARLAVWVQNYWAPLLVFPLLVGCGLGLLLAGLMRVGQVGHRPTLCSGALVAAAVAVAGQHYFAYRDFQAALIAQRPQGLGLEDFQKMMPQTSTDFPRFMQRQAARGRPVTAKHELRGAAAWASWAADGLLVLLAALTIVCLACRAPYCSRCRSWYRTTRAGRLDAGMAGRLAEAAALPLAEPPGAAQYRLSHCSSGCGPSRLQLACGQEKTKVVEAWLCSARREHVARVLDGMN